MDKMFPHENRLSLTEDINFQYQVASYEADANNFLNLSAAVLLEKFSQFINVCSFNFKPRHGTSQRMTASHTLKIGSGSEDQSFRIKCTGFEFEAK